MFVCSPTFHEYVVDFEDKEGGGGQKIPKSCGRHKVMRTCPLPRPPPPLPLLCRWWGRTCRNADPSPEMTDDDEFPDSLRATAVDEDLSLSGDADEADDPSDLFSSLLCHYNKLND